MRKQVVEIALGFNAVTAIVGGIALMSEFITPPHSWLNETIFSSYFIPGLILTIVVGGSALFAYLAYMKDEKLAPVTALFSGAILIGWILNEIALTQQLAWLQFMYLGLGALIIGLTYTDVKILLVRYVPHIK
jgi:hypothetical protein